MVNKLLEFLENYRKVKVSLDVLINIYDGSTDYYKYANDIKNLEDKGIIKPVNSSGRNSRNPSLAYIYSINKNYFKDILVNNIQSLQQELTEYISLKPYYRMNLKQLQDDIPLIMMVNNYIIENGLPNEVVSPSQRSFEIFGDEKFIQNKGGEAFLKRLQIYDLLKIENNNDPLMLAVNPATLVGNEHLHLVVENRTTYYALLDGLNKMPFTSLVYGAGWKSVGNLYQLPKQICKDNNNHIFYYFGDLDNEGVAIWYALKEKYSVILATEFYKALLKKDSTKVKKNHKIDKLKLKEFLIHFNDEEQKLIENTLLINEYYPQEYLTSNELQKIWRNMVD